MVGVLVLKKTADEVSVEIAEEIFVTKAYCRSNSHLVQMDQNPIKYSIITNSIIGKNY